MKELKVKLGDKVSEGSLVLVLDAEGGAGGRAAARTGGRSARSTGSRAGTRSRSRRSCAAPASRQPAASRGASCPTSATSTRSR